MDDGGKLPLMAQTPPDEEIGDALRVARETLPKKEYKPFNVLPLREDEQGVHFDPYAGALGAVTRPFRYFKETMTGEKPMDVTSPEAIQSAADLGSAMTLGSGAFESPEGALRAGIKAYHGSPHLFAPTERNPLGEFDLSKIGTGEGAQVFGHGVYLADLEDVANEYRYIGSNINPDIVKYNGKTIQQHYVSALKEQDRARRLNDRKAVTNADAKVYFWENLMTGNHPKQVLDTALKDIEEWPELVSYASSIDPEKFSGVGKAGHMYEAEIAAEPHQLLDWYKPLKAQPEMVERVSSVLPNETLLNDWKKSGALLHAPFASIYKGAAGGSRADVSAGRPAEFSRKLKESGIPGIQYLDAGSRGAGEGTHNYVIFDPSIIDIKRRYADGGEVSGSVDLAQQDEDIQNALRIAKEPVRYDTGPQPGEPILSSYDPTIKERIYQTVAGTETRPSPERAGFARGVSQMAEFAPFLGNVMAGQEAYRRGDTKGMVQAIVPVPAAKMLGPKNLPTSEIFKRAVEATPKARIEEGSLVLPVARRQMAAQELEPSTRGGVFYLPEGDKNLKYYSSAKNYYGGQEKIGGETAYNNPLFVKGATGGRAPETAYEVIHGKGSAKKLDSDVRSIVSEQRWMTKQDPDLYLERVANFLKEKGVDDADENLAWNIVQNSKHGNQLFFALREYIIGNSARKAGYDSIMGYSLKRDPKKTPFISEIFDLRESHYPGPSGEYEVFEQFKPYSTGGTASGTMNDDVKSALRIANSRLGRADGGKVSFVKFDDKSGTLGIPRDQMPQIKSENKGALVNFLNAKGIKHKKVEVDPDSLKPTQREFSPEKIKGVRENVSKDRTILVSKDGHVIDGHHQWLAAKEDGEKVKAIVFNKNVRDVLDTIKEFPSSTVDNASRVKRASGGEIPTPPRRPDDLEHYAVMADAQKKFPFINKYDPHIKVEPREGDGMYSEFYNAEETGDPKDPSTWRPEEFPYGSSGVRVYRPEEFTPADYAAEYLHGDSVANKTREELISRLTPEQLDYIKGQPDYQESVKLGLPEERALNNVVDAMMRGYTMQDEPSHQWPKESLAELDFTPEELELLNSLQDYVEAPAQAAPSPEAAPAEETPERKLGGKINTIVDADPYFRLSNLKKGGSIDHALKLSRDHMAYGGLPDSYMDDDRYKTFQQIGGTKTDPRSEAIGRFLPRMTYHESRDRPLAGAKTSSAAGLAQFTRPTWRKITEGEPEVAGKSREELYAMRRDPSEEGQRFHMRMAEKLANQNADMLEKAGLPVTPQNLYAAHFGGPHGVQAAAAPAGTPLSRIFSRGEIRANPFLRGQTVEGFRKFAQNAISETPRGLPTDLEFQRSQSPTNRYEGLQTAMAGAQPQTPPTSPTQMAYAQPQQRGFSPDLMTPHPVPQPTRMAHLPDMQVGGQRMMAADRGSMAGGSGSGVPEIQTAMAQPIPQQEPQIEQATYQPEPERPNQDMLEGIEQPFVGWPDFDIAGLFADGGVVGDALRLATGGRTPAWTRAAGKAKSGGLNAEGRASYNRANPGKPGLKPPAPHPKTERDANRRKSFCSRMKGMKNKLTSAETARDPDSRINKSLRAWNCADGGQVWDKPRPKHLGEPEPLSAKQKKSAKAAAKAAGRPWPNMIDSMRAAQKKK